MGRGATVAIVAATIVFAVSDAAGAGHIRSEPVCGPIGAKTLTSDSEARVYTVSRPGDAHGAFQGLRVYGCLASTGDVVRLGRPPGGSRVFGQRNSGLADTPIVLRPPWVAFGQRFHGIDTGVLTVAARNLRTGAARYCAVGFQSHPRHPPPELTDLALDRSGRMAYIVTAWNREVEPWVYEPTVGACTLARRESQPARLDGGSQIGVHSLRLEGETLSWENEGATRTASLRSPAQP